MVSATYLPNKIGIELVRGRYFEYPSCQTSSESSSKELSFQFMDLSLLKKLINEIDQWPSITEIHLFGFGESMAHPHYAQCLEIIYRLIRAKHINIIQYTNAFALDGSKAESILNIPIIKTLVFLLDDFTNNEMNKNIHFNLVRQNIKQFMKQAKIHRPELIFANLSREEIPGLKVFEKNERTQKFNSLLNLLEAQDRSEDIFDYVNKDSILFKKKMSQRIFGGCPFFEQDFLFFTVNGFAQPCGTVYDENFKIGKFPDQGFSALLNNNFINKHRHALRMDHRIGIPFCESCSISIGGTLDGPELKKIWKMRDHQGLIQDLSERYYIFVKIIPYEQPILKLDLGCSPTKEGGFIGIGRYPNHGIDIIADLEKILPFIDNIFDLIILNFTVYQFGNILNILKEIFRICKHGAQVCIIAPYYHSKLNMANPNYKNVFNEYSPIYWDQSEYALIKNNESNSIEMNKLKKNKGKDPVLEFNFRCLKKEFFYFLQYRYLPDQKKVSARNKLLDVCDQIIYHLLVVKNPISEDNMNELSKHTQYFEPSYITIRKLKENNEYLDKKLKETEADLERINQTAKSIINQMNMFENRRSFRLINRFLNKTDFYHIILPHIKPLEDKNHTFIKKSFNFRLKPSDNLQNISFLNYFFYLSSQKLIGIMLLFKLDFPINKGILGIEIWSPDNQLLIQKTIPANQVAGDFIRFDFPPIRYQAQSPCCLKVFAKEIDVPVRIWEWQKYYLWGFGPLQKKLFCGLIFQ